MADLVRLRASRTIVADSFCQLAQKPKYQYQWRTSEQWVTILLVEYNSILSNIMEEDALDAKMLDGALRSVSNIKLNLNNYTAKSNSTGIMHRSYRPRLILNGEQKRGGIINCYLAVPPYSAEPTLPSGTSWWETLPPTRIRESNRVKRSRTSLNEKGNIENEVEEIVNNQPYFNAHNSLAMEEKKQDNFPMQFDPWEDTKVRMLFLPSSDAEHAKDAIARRIDILFDARTQPEGYKTIVEGEDQYNNCTKLDVIKLNDKCMYLISALTLALNNYPTKTWRQCCENASQICGTLTHPYSGRTVEGWWCSFREKNRFPHPRGPEGNSKTFKQKLPPFLRDNEDLHKHLMKFCRANLSDLSIDRVKEYVRDKLIPSAIPLTDEIRTCWRRH